MHERGKLILPSTDMEALVETACTGGECAMDRLIAAVWPRAYRIALSVLREPALAEDAAQESCAILFRSIRKLRSARAFNVWFYRIVVREALVLQKRSEAMPASAAPRAEADLESALIRADIVQALNALPPVQRIVIALHYFGQMSSREAGDVLGIPDSSVRFHIMRAKHTLQKLLNEERSGAA